MRYAWQVIGSLWLLYGAVKSDRRALRTPAPRLKRCSEGWDDKDSEQFSPMNYRRSNVEEASYSFLVVLQIGLSAAPLNGTFG